MLAWSFSLTATSRIVILEEEECHHYPLVVSLSNYTSGWKLPFMSFDKLRMSGSR